jgi:hypothetical protein
MSPGRFLLVTVLVLSGCGETFFKRNPSLIQLWQFPPGSFWCSSPAWSPDGGKVYFIGGGFSQLRVVNSDGSDERLLFDSSFSSVCVSPDGTRLVVTAGDPVAGGGLVWLDFDGGILDTFSLSGSAIAAVRCGKSSETLYCEIYGKGIFRLDMGSRRMDTIMLASLLYADDFDVSGDTLLATPGIVYHMLSGKTDSVPVLRQPRFCPSDPNVLLGVLGTGEFKNDVALVDRTSGSVTHLDAKPFYSCDIMDPCLSPDGTKLVMAASEVVWFGEWPDNGQDAVDYNIWEMER